MNIKGWTGHTKSVGIGDGCRNMHDATIGDLRKRPVKLASHLTYALKSLSHLRAGSDTVGRWYAVQLPCLQTNAHRQPAIAVRWLTVVNNKMANSLIVT